MEPDEELRHRRLIEKITHRGPTAFKKFTSILNVHFPDAFSQLETKFSGIDRSLHNHRTIHVPLHQTQSLPTPQLHPQQEIVEPTIVGQVLVPPPTFVIPNEAVPMQNEAAALPSSIASAYPELAPIKPMELAGGLKLEYYTKPVEPRRNIRVKLSDRFHVSPKISSYDMRSAKRGLLFLVNIINFEKKKRRNGADVDRDNLINLFRQMHFQIMYYEDITKAVRRI